MPTATDYGGSNGRSHIEIAEQAECLSMTRRLGLFAAVLTLGGGVSTNAFGNEVAYNDEDVIEYRQHIMKALDEQTAIIGQIVSGLIPNDNVFSHLEAIALLAAVSLRSFEPEVQGGEASPKIWSEWDDFASQMNDFAARTREAADRARVVGRDEALSQILDTLTCKACHDKYRIE